MGRGRRWWAAIRNVVDEVQRDQLTLAAAGIAFYSLLALVPALIAVLSVFALVTDPQSVRDQLQPLFAALPGSAAEVARGQLESATRLGAQGPTVGLVAGAAGVLWSTSTAMRALITGLTRAFDETETRGFLRVRGLALLLTVIAIIVAAVSLGALAALPLVLDVLRVPGDQRWIIGVARWAGLIVLVSAALSVLYRFGPDRDRHRRRWFGWGTITALGVWLAGSAGLTLYAENLADYQSTYGVFAGLVVLLLWLYLSAFAVLLGAEVDAEVERRRGGAPG
ncbi:YihY/virulence factor BrkB family protein [Prauserella muralis]|uniref:YihY/virulence factor BrkB family protein n=1 Tax=Prauserella muralis TaxID=588067 RepID=UPI000DD38975|nr:YihY/virulence factor BrkB family protein [Prauserella muralis]